MDLSRFVVKPALGSAASDKINAGALTLQGEWVRDGDRLSLVFDLRELRPGHVRISERPRRGNVHGIRLFCSAATINEPISVAGMPLVITRGNVNITLYADAAKIPAACAAEFVRQRDDDARRAQVALPPASPDATPANVGPQVGGYDDTGWKNGAIS